MIMQRIKRWLGAMFSWWPWRHLQETTYVSSARALNTGYAQEPLFQTTNDGLLPPSGVTSIAIEPLEDAPKQSWPSMEDRAEPSSLRPLQAKELPHTFLPSPNKSANAQSDNQPTSEQQLEFLRFLVKRGIVNEGFQEGQVPEQYRKR